jgi:hypothetical protein
MIDDNIRQRQSLAYDDLFSDNQQISIGFMAERKRPSTTDRTRTTNAKKIKLIQTTLPQMDTSNRPLCKYDGKCYRKHPEHLRAFRHSTHEKTDTNKQLNDDESSVTQLTSSSTVADRTFDVSSKPVISTTVASSTVSLMELAELTNEKLLARVYQMNFPSDLYDLWKFCSTLNKTKPRGKSNGEIRK